MSDIPCAPRELDAFARRWLLQTAKRNLWRVAAWMDLDDLIGDGVLCWQIVVRRYPQVTERRQLMALFMRTYSNHLHRLANRRSEQALELEVTDSDLLDEHAPASEDAVHRLVMEQAPPVLRRALLAIIDRPELLQLPRRRWLDGRRESTNQWLCRLAGANPERYDLHSQLNELLGRQQAMA